MTLPANLPIDSLEYQLTSLHLRQKGFLPTAHCELQLRCRSKNVEILNIVENTYNGILTVVVGAETACWDQNLEEELTMAARQGAVILRDPQIRFGLFACDATGG
jgi:hypothetical protein